MNRFIEFIGHHWLLSAAFVLILLLLIWEEMRAKGGGHRVSPQEAINLINREDGIVIDVRDRNVFQQGHIVDAVNVSQTELGAEFEKLKKYKDKCIILVCGSGQTTGLLGMKLRKSGFARVYILAGGLQAWTSANLPLAKG